MDKNREDYLAFVAKRRDIPLFFQPWWLDIMCGEDDWKVLLHRDTNNQIDAIWPFPRRHQWRLKVSRQPPLTPFLGLLILPSKTTEGQIDSDRQIIRSMIEGHLSHGFVFYNQLFPSYFDDWRDFGDLGYQQETFYRNVVDLSGPRQSIFENFSGSVRTWIRKFECDCIIEESEDIELLYKLIQNSHRDSDNELSYSFATFKALVKALMIKTESKVFVAKCGKDKKVIAGCLLALDNRRAYFLAHGIKSEFRNSGAASALVWHSIKYSQEYVSFFDFAGSMIEPISTFMTDFGGTFESYFRIYRFKNKLYKKIHNLLEAVK